MARKWKGAFEVQNGAADFSPGLKVRITGRLAGRMVSLSAVVREYEDPRACSRWAFEDDYGVSGVERWELVPENGCTAVRFTSRYHSAGLLGRVFDSSCSRAALWRAATPTILRGSPASSRASVLSRACPTLPIPASPHNSAGPSGPAGAASFSLPSGPSTGRPAFSWARRGVRCQAGAPRSTSPSRSCSSSWAQGAEYLLGERLALEPQAHHSRHPFSSGAALLARLTALAAAAVCASFLERRLHSAPTACSWKEAFGSRFWHGALWGVAQISLLVLLIAALHGYSFWRIGVRSGNARALRYRMGRRVSAGRRVRGRFSFSRLPAVHPRPGEWASGRPRFCFPPSSVRFISPIPAKARWAPSAFLCGMFLCLTLRRTGNLWFAIGWHAAFDFGETLLFSVPNSGIDHHRPASPPPAMCMGRAMAYRRHRGGPGRQRLRIFVVLLLAFVVFDRLYCRPARRAVDRRASLHQADSFFLRAQRGLTGLRQINLFLHVAGGSALFIPRCLNDQPLGLGSASAISSSTSSTANRFAPLRLVLSPSSGVFTGRCRNTRWNSSPAFFAASSPWNVARIVCASCIFAAIGCSTPVRTYRWPARCTGEGSMFQLVVAPRPARRKST